MTSTRVQAISSSKAAKAVRPRSARASLRNVSPDAGRAMGGGRTGACDKGASGLARAIAAAPIAKLTRDRKSTRLNFSHGYISYAVFCLKKKKKKCEYHDIS